MANIETILIGIGTIVLLFYWYISRKYRYWSDRGISGPKPTFLIGNILQRVQKPPRETELKWFKKYGKMYGYYLGTKPILTVTDPELVRQIMVKDFGSFVNRRKINIDFHYAKQNLFALEDDKWKTIRSIVSPMFSTSNLRRMRFLINQCVDRVDRYLISLAKGLKDQQSVIRNTKELITGFTIDVIALTTFATETNANSNGGQNNPFVYNTLNFFNFNPFKLIMMLVLPKRINNLFGGKFFYGSETSEFFIKLTNSMIENRRNDNNNINNNIVNNEFSKSKVDILHLMLNASVGMSELKNISYDKLMASSDNLDNGSNGNNGTQIKDNLSKRMLTNVEIQAQSMLFLLAGIEPVALTLTNLIFELCRNPHIQQRLFDEINSKLGLLDHESDLFYENVTNQMPYLEAVIKETLRKYPTLLRIERRVGVDGYRLGDCSLAKGQLIEIPLHSLHHNPEYFPKPDLFDPDRFMPEFSHQLVPYSYVAFGVGPRNCVAMRFGFQVMKLFTAQIVRKYRFSATPNTPDELKFRKGLILSIAFPYETGVELR